MTNQIHYKMSRKALNTLIFILGILFPVPLISQNTYTLKSYNVVVAGTSNLHDWTADVGKASGTFKLKVDNGKIVSIQSVDLKVDAQSLVGSKGSIMNSKIKDALKSKKNPFITFRSTNITVNGNSGIGRIVANGVLNIAGTSQNISIEVTGKILPNGDVEFSGTKKLKMTDYNVEPPKAMLGALTTANDVTLTFKVVLTTS